MLSDTGKSSALTALSQEKRILNLLHSAWPNWTPAPALARVSLQYNARVFSLRRKGWTIANRVTIVDGIRHGEFRLRTAPVSSSKDLRQRQAPPVAEASTLFPDLAPETMRHRDDG
jgi:hypothetical protein